MRLPPYGRRAIPRGSRISDAAMTSDAQPTPNTDEIVIIGAGIGGLAAALSLHQHGFAVRVLESVPKLEPLGVGINVLPHAVRELDELGLQGAIERAGVRCEKLSYHTKCGRCLDQGPLRTGGPFSSTTLPSGSRRYIDGPVPSAP
jgi:hypothetical protein